MEVQQLLHLSFMLNGIFVFFIPSVCSGIETPKIILENTVFVAFTGHELNIRYRLKVPANQSRDTLTCFDPFHVQIYNTVLNKTDDLPKTFEQSLEMKNLKSSGEYSCRYKTAKVYWFLLVRDDGYKEITELDYTECIIVGVFAGVLLVFSVVGSVYVFRRHWKEQVTGKKQKQEKEERKEREPEKDNVDVLTATSTSFYASLEARPGSIYDVLDRSAANTKPDQSEAKPKKKKPPNRKVQTTQPQHEDAIDCVYENF